MPPHQGAPRAQGARTWATLAVGFLPVLLAAWSIGGPAGCAAGDVDTGEEDTGGGTPTDGGGDGIVSGDSGKVDGGGKDTAPLSCPDSGALNTCATATDVGMLAIGASKTITSSLPISGGDRWFKVTFQQLDDPKVHPHVKLTPTPAGTGDAGSPFVFEVMKSCSKDDVTCGKEDGGSAAKVTDFESLYGPDPDGGADGEADPDADGDPDAAGDARIPIKVGASGTVYVRVYRTGVPTTCDTFKLDFSN